MKSIIIICSHRKETNRHLGLHCTFTFSTWLHNLIWVTPIPSACVCNFSLMEIKTANIITGYDTSSMDYLLLTSIFNVEKTNKFKQMLEKYNTHDDRSLSKPAEYIQALWKIYRMKERVNKRRQYNFTMRKQTVKTLLKYPASASLIDTAHSSAWEETVDKTTRDSERNRCQRCSQTYWKILNSHIWHTARQECEIRGRR